jgi:putative flippase GtrA
MMYKAKNFLLLYFSEQFLRFVFAGGMGAGINITARVIFRNYLQIGYELSYIFAYLIGFFSILFLYKKFVFPFSDLPVRSQIQRFIVINISFAPLSAILFIIFTKLFNFLEFQEFSELLAHAISIASPAAITFLLYKFLAFKNSSERLQEIIK